MEIVHAPHSSGVPRRDRRRRARLRGPGYTRPDHAKKAAPKCRRARIRRAYFAAVVARRRRAYFADGGVV
jgi:hypothetical protein